MIRSWKNGRAGPCLAVGAVLFQAAFHDITEAFALMLLAVWWLSLLTEEGTQKVRIESGKVRVFVLAAGTLLFFSSLWLNLDVVSRALWARGQEHMATDVHRAEMVLENTMRLNPLLPGAARDLAKVRLARVYETGRRSDLEKAEKSILRARRLNHLDTAPIRLLAALYIEIAKVDPDMAAWALVNGAEKLEEAAVLEPHNAMILLNLSGVYWDLGDRQRALQTINHALTEEPNYLEAHRLRMDFLAQTDPGRVEEARQELEEARERSAGYRPYSEYEEILLR